MFKVVLSLLVGHRVLSDRVQKAHRVLSASGAGVRGPKHWPTIWGHHLGSFFMELFRVTGTDLRTATSVPQTPPPKKKATHSCFQTEITRATTTGYIKISPHHLRRPPK